MVPPWGPFWTVALPEDVLTAMRGAGLTRVPDSAGNGTYYGVIKGGRRPGQGKLTTARSENDKVKILSGVFQGKTTGTPISFVVFNEDQRSGDYSDIEKWFRPGHADLCYDLKYGFRDFRGGGRSSARETIGRVAAGTVARLFLKQVAGVEFVSWVDSVGAVDCPALDLETLTHEVVEASPVRCPDASASARMEQEILDAKKNGDSVGGTVGLVVRNVPVALGEPVFDRLDALLAQYEDAMTVLKEDSGRYN